MTAELDHVDVQRRDVERARHADARLVSRMVAHEESAWAEFRLDYDRVILGRSAPWPIVSRG
ncbi:hypothetical protein [Labilithrix luteola]|nr:hypothetical protein [Labilithrix luteola]